MQRFFGLGLAALVLVGCSGDESTPATAGGTTNSPTPTAGGKDPNKSVPQDTEGGQDEVAPEVPINCAGEAGTFYGLKVKKLIGGSELPLCAYKDTAVLIVNGASDCGYTPQYKPIQALYEKYKDKKFTVLAFPSNSFNQEDHTAQEVSEFCTTEYKITFPLAEIAPVSTTSRPADVIQPVYQWIYAQPGYSQLVDWNFEKYLVGKDGKIVKWFDSSASPADGGEIDQAIAAEVAK